MIALALASLLTTQTPATPTTPAPTPAPAPSPAPAPAKRAWAKVEPPPCSFAALLVAHDVDALQGGRYCELCKSVDEMACELDWPTSDVPTCEILDEMRNAIFAYYGRAFTKPKWQKHFRAQKWYAVRADYDDAQLSRVAATNVQKLLEQRKKLAAVASASGDATCRE